MYYLYHRVPEQMEGNILYPLNTLKEKNPELYEKESAKYKDREQVMEQRIPTLNCMWNDVLHLSPIHPTDLKKALSESGIETREMKFYQIDPETLDPANTTVYLYAHTDKADNMKLENFSPYDPSMISQYSTVSEETKAYYKEMKAKGGRPLLFVKVPHILYKGSIDTSNIPVKTIEGTSWNTYFEKTKNKPASSLLVRAIPFVDSKHSALDLGAGALNDSRYLIENGFNNVTAVDATPMGKDIAATLPTDKFSYIISAFDQFDFLSETYDLVNAQYALPFFGKVGFEAFIEKIISSLKLDGIFVGQFFGNRDEWNTPDSNRSFQTIEEAQQLLSGLEIIEFTEEEKEGTTAIAKQKHWHVFHFIARKK